MLQALNRHLRKWREYGLSLCPDCYLPAFKTLLTKPNLLVTFTMRGELPQMEEEKLPFSHFVPLVIAVWRSALKGTRVTHISLLTLHETDAASESAISHRMEPETAPG